MTNRFSRLSRIEEKKAYRRIFLTALGTVAIVLVVIFLGLPAVIRFSLFLGNIKSSSSPTTSNDTTPPFPPHLEASYTATNSATITITGYTEPGVTLEVFKGGISSKKVNVGSDGQFKIANFFLNDGVNRITAIAKDSTGNTSQVSDPLLVTYKVTPPKLDISEPQDNQSFSGDQKYAEIKGVTESGATVSINGRIVNVKDDGSFIYSYPLGNGDNNLKIVSTDIAGNQTSVEKKVTYNN